MQGNARQCKTMQGKLMQGNARQCKARPGKGMHVYTNHFLGECVLRGVDVMVVVDRLSLVREETLETYRLLARLAVERRCVIRVLLAAEVRETGAARMLIDGPLKTWVEIIGPANRPAFCGTVPLFYQMSRVPLNHGNVSLFVRSRIFFCARAICNAARCPDVNANHPIERNYGNSVRFLAKILNGTRPNRRATVYFGTQLISVGCILLKKSQCGPCQPSRILPASPVFLREMSLKKHSPGWQVWII